MLLKPGVKREQSPILPVRFPKQTKIELETLARENGESRSETVRRLVELGLQSERARTAQL